MPTAASAALRAAIHDTLIADAALTSMLGGPKIYDEPPRAAAFPYITLGETRIDNYFWMRDRNGVTDATGTAITINGADEVLVTGSFTGSSITFGTDTLHSLFFGQNFYVIKYDAAGNPAGHHQHQQHRLDPARSYRLPIFPI